MSACFKQTDFFFVFQNVSIGLFKLKNLNSFIDSCRPKSKVIIDVSLSKARNILTVMPALSYFQNLFENVSSQTQLNLSLPLFVKQTQHFFVFLKQLLDLHFWNSRTHSSSPFFYSSQFELWPFNKVVVFYCFKYRICF